jgi:predicted nucleic acid-binding protein
MILVDTSVWIEFFRGNEPYFTKLKELIESSDVLAHEVVFGELLQTLDKKILKLLEPKYGFEK